MGKDIDNITRMQIACLYTAPRAARAEERAIIESSVNISIIRCPIIVTTCHHYNW